MDCGFSTPCRVNHSDLRLNYSAIITHLSFPPPLATTYSSWGQPWSASVWSFSFSLTKPASVWSGRGGECWAGGGEYVNSSLPLPNLSCAGKFGYKENQRPSWLTEARTQVSQVYGVHSPCPKPQVSQSIPKGQRAVFQTGMSFSYRLMPAVL